MNEGFKAAGYEIAEQIAKPERGDVLLVWSRQGGYHEQACEFERRGGTVVVAENGYLGKGWRGGEWVSLAIGQHAGAGRWPDLGPSRWDAWDVELQPWRCDGLETVILGQRGFGSPQVRSPDRWAEQVQARIGGRIRQHPGTGQAKPLADDLADAREVVTWNSGAALQALLLGVPVWFDFPQWIGAGAARPLSAWGGEPLRDDAARLHMFRRLAWAMASLDEIRTGEPIARLLSLA